MPQPESTSPVPAFATVPQVSGHVCREADRFRHQFVHAQPFRHISIDNFFEHEFAERLLEDFPRFNPDLARNEMGEVAGKAVNTRIREISPTYRELYEIIGGSPFLELMSRISGIPDLILDPRMYGGGTHENLHGQELDPHVDFNYDEEQKLHRRLNVIVYLNKGWRTEWGGAIEIHSNPRNPDANQIRAFDPIFNRCVMFETNEISWHGFPRINLPPEQRHVSRKSISIYLYTTTRPAEEIAPVHGTFYVQRPLSTRFREGLTLTADDVAEIKDALWRRDIWTPVYHKMELEKNREIDGKTADVRHMMAQYDKLTADTKAAIRGLEEQVSRLTEQSRKLAEQSRDADAGIKAERDALLEALNHDRQFARVPLTGYATQSRATGVHSDLWIAPRAQWEIHPLVKMDGLRLRGWRPAESPPATVRVKAGDALVEARVSGGAFTVEVPLRHVTGEALLMAVECDALPRQGADDRDVAFKIVELRIKHPLGALLKEVRK